MPDPQRPTAAANERHTHDNPLFLTQQRPRKVSTNGGVHFFDVSHTLTLPHDTTHYIPPVGKRQSETERGRRDVPG